MSARKILFIVFITIFIDMLGIGVLIPVFPLLILPHSIFNVIPPTWTSGQALVMAGWLMAVFPLMQFICTPLLGHLSDRFGRRKILILSIAGTAISYVVFAIAILNKNIFLMFISRALDGVTGGNIAVAQAVIGDISVKTPKNMAKNFAIVGMAFGSGFILGPFIGGKLSDPAVINWFNAATPFFFTAVISLINALLVLCFLPETFSSRNEHKPLMVLRPIYNIFQMFLDKQLKSVIPVIFLFNSGFTFFTTFFGVVLATKYGFDQSKIGNFFAYLGIMVVLAQGVVVRRMSGKVADYVVLRYSLIGTGICLLMYYFIPFQHTGWIYFIPPFMAIFIALTPVRSVMLNVPAPDSFNVFPTSF